MPGKGILNTTGEPTLHLALIQCEQCRLYLQETYILLKIGEWPQVHHLLLLLQLKEFNHELNHNFCAELALQNLLGMISQERLWIGFFWRMRKRCLVTKHLEWHLGPNTLWGKRNREVEAWRRAKNHLHHT